MGAMTRSLPVALLLLVSFAACRRGSEGVVARVGKAAITESEFRRKLGEVAPDYQNYVLTPHGRRQFLDVLIREKLILEAAKADGTARTPEFREQMSRLRREEEEKLSAARDYLLTHAWFDRLRAEGAMRVTDEDVRDYHKKHPTEVLARHVLLPTADEAEEALNRVRKGARFAAVAQKSSLDADTAAQGGQMNPSLFGETIPELEVLFKMKVGEVAGPVRSKFGYHVLVKEGERPVPIEVAADRIRNILEKQKLDQHLQSLQSSYPVEVVDAQFK